MCLLGEFILGVNTGAIDLSIQVGVIISLRRINGEEGGSRVCLTKGIALVVHSTLERKKRERREGETKGRRRRRMKRNLEQWHGLVQSQNEE